MNGEKLCLGSLFLSSCVSIVTNTLWFTPYSFTDGGLKEIFFIALFGLGIFYDSQSFKCRILVHNGSFRKLRVLQQRSEAQWPIISLLLLPVLSDWIIRSYLVQKPMCRSSKCNNHNCISRILFPKGLINYQH